MKELDNLKLTEIGCGFNRRFIHKKIPSHWSWVPLTLHRSHWDIHPNTPHDTATASLVLLLLKEFKQAL